MTAKEYLTQIKNLDRVIRIKLAEIEQLRDMASNITAVIKEDVVQTSMKGDKLSDAVAKIIDEEQAVASLTEKYLNMKREAIHMIENLSNPLHYQVLWERYISDRTYEGIAGNMGFSNRHIFKLHNSALLEFEEKYNEFLKKLS